MVSDGAGELSDLAASASLGEVAPGEVLLEAGGSGKSSAGMVGTGFLLILRTLDAADLTVWVDDDAAGPRQTLSSASDAKEACRDDDRAAVAVIMLGQLCWIKWGQQW